MAWTVNGRVMSKANRALQGRIEHYFNNPATAITDEVRKAVKS